MKSRSHRIGFLSRGLVSAAILLSAAALPGRPALADAHLSVDLGVRSLRGFLWEGMDSQPSAGISILYSRPKWPVQLAFALHASGDEQVRTETEVIPETSGCIPFLFCWTSGGTVTREITAQTSLEELSFGVDKVWRSRSSGTRWFVGGGPAFLKASITQFEPGVQGEDHSAALWAHAGILRVHEPAVGISGFHWGFEVRALGGSELKIGSAEGDADYLYVGLLGGLDW